MTAASRLRPNPLRRLVAVRRATSLVVRSATLVVGLILRRALGRDDDVDQRLLLWARKTARSLDLHVHVEGDVPSGPVLLVANHLSYLDIPMLWTLVPGHFVARADVADWPGIGPASKWIGTIFLDRDRKRSLLDVLPTMTDVLRGGRSVLFFPEATSTRGDEVLPFKSSLFEAAIRTGAPVVAASLQYETPSGNPSAGLSVCWWGDMTFLPHLRDLLSLPSIEARVRFSPVLQASNEGSGPERPMERGEASTRPPQAGLGPSILHRSRKRKELCRLAYEAVQKKFIPTTPPESSERSGPPPLGRIGAASRAAPPAR